MGWIIGIAVLVLGVALAFFADHKSKHSRDGWNTVNVASTVVTIAVSLTLVVSFALTQSLTRFCEQRADEIGYEAEWTLFTDCIVETPSGPFPISQLRRFDE